MKNFLEMVWSRELIKHAIKNKMLKGKITSAPIRKVMSTKKKEGETQAMFTNQQYRGQASYSNQPSFSTSNLPHVQPLNYQTNNTQTEPQSQSNNSSSN